MYDFPHLKEQDAEAYRSVTYNTCSMVEAFDEIEAFVLGEKCTLPQPKAKPEEKASPARTPLVAIFEEKAIRILGTVEDPLFCAADVAAHIGNSHDYMRVVSKYTISTFLQKVKCANTRGEKRSMYYLTEAGLYKYLLQAKGAKAEEFQLFVYNLLKEERKRTVDSIQLALKIARSQRDVAIHDQEAMCRAANEARTQIAQLTKQNAKLLRYKYVKEDADFMRHMGRGHLVEEPQEEASSNDDEEEEY